MNLDTTLPSPQRDRWQPLRSGVLNLYRFDYEEFHFADGRVLLRGNNGSGKSRVLALQLPFLLDGETSPARVEPDGDPAKRIEWNLLMGRYPDRTGYTWIEFGRRDSEGVDHYLTLGCGLRAVAGHSGLHSRWFFLTSQRVGRDLFLQNHQRTPLGRDRLAEALGSSGRIFQKAEDYRRSVDAALFGLGSRYGALIELLIRLRRPQLTRKLDENELPEALSEALPTIPAAIVDEVAESFRSLQADRDTVRGFVAAQGAVVAFLAEYTGYIRIALRRRAAAVRSAHSTYEQAGRKVRDATARLEAATEALAALAVRIDELNLQLVTAETEERTLANSPEMRTAEEIRHASEAATAAEKVLAAAQSDEADAAARLQLAQSQQRLAEENSAGIDAQCDAQLQRAATAATAADFADIHRSQLPLDPAGIAPGAEAALGRELSRRARNLKHLRALEATAATSARILADVERAWREAEAALGLAREEEHAARQDLAARGAALVSAYTEWQAGVTTLRPEPPAELIEAFEAWMERREGAGPFRRAADSAYQRALARAAAREAELTREAEAIDARIRELNTEVARLETGATSPPLPPPTRRADRGSRPGAPLWRVCDFHPDVATADRAGLEAALQAAGLLDAWLLPDGSLCDPATEDTFLVVSGQPELESHLGQRLVPSLDPQDAQAAALSPAIVARTLTAIGFQPSGSSPGGELDRDSFGRAQSARPARSHAWVATDGSWQVGPLSGRWSKPAAEYIGEATRAAARRRQIEFLRRQLADAHAELARAQSSLAQLVQDRASADAEIATAPTEEPVARAGYALEAAVRRVAESTLASERAGQAAELRRADWSQQQSKLQQDAADLKLEAWLGRLDELDTASQVYSQLLAALWPTLRHRDSLAAQVATVREQSQTAETILASRSQRRLEAAALSASARSRFQTLQETHGQAIASIVARHSAAVAALAELKREIASKSRDQLAQTEARSSAHAERESAEEKRASQEIVRAEAIARLRQLAIHRLLVTADPALRDYDGDEEWSVARAVDIARDIEPRLADTPADAADWERRQDQIHAHFQELRDRLLVQGHSSETHQLDDLVVVRSVFQSRPLTMTELHAAFAAEIETREQILQANEREIIENHLLADVSIELQKLIRAAEAWRVSANEELHARPTSTGVRFRFQWEADTEMRFHEVRPILLRRGELWSPPERSAVAAFLQGRIAAEQDAEESGSWRDHLTRALDYRRWHRFVIERQQEGQWRRLNKATYGTGSGGEKALALTLPRFAAAAAHYRGAAPTAPRLVMLDEAFAGIDPTMRAQCLGVLAQFDLDVVMTSELEWGCYATVPALGIYHLTTLPGLDAVAATHWRWNGRERRQVDHPAPVTIPPDPTDDPLAPDLISGPAVP